MISNKKVHPPLQPQGDTEVQEWKLYIVSSEITGQSLKGQEQEDHLHQDRIKSALLISMPFLLNT